MQQLVLFLTRYRNNLLLLALLLLAIVRHSLKNQVSEHWVNSFGTQTSAKFSKLTNHWKSYWKLDKINEELSRENASLRAALQHSNAPEFSAMSSYDFIPARVVDYSYRKKNNYILINQGKKLGIHPGMGVINGKGWIGTVIESTPNYAYVLPFIHSKGDIGARINGKGLGQLSWSGKTGFAILEDIEREYQPVPGDSVYSFTRLEVAPPVLTGIVTSASQSEEDLSWDAEVDLISDFTSLNWIYVCRFKDKTEVDTLRLIIE